MTFDANGNTLNDGTNSYSWDARNRLVSADGTGASFAYDPLGRRVSKTVMSTTTSYLYDGANAVKELSGAETVSLSTGGVDERLTRTDSSGTTSYLTDALGSTVALTDATGASQTQYSYSPYGAQSATGAITANSYAYTGREFDGLGIDYYRARYYNPTTGRFLSEDPAGFLGSGLNLYTYAGDDPIDRDDPSGEFPIYGNWCGGDWTGAQKEQYDPSHDTVAISFAVSSNYQPGVVSTPYYKPPIDALDEACEQHDKCYYL